MKVQIHRDGEETVMILPDELIASLGWQPGDVLEASTDGNGLKIGRPETTHERGVRIAKKAMKRYG